MIVNGHGVQELVIVHHPNAQWTAVAYRRNACEGSVVKAAALAKAMSGPVYRQCRQEHHGDVGPVDNLTRTHWLAQAEWTGGKWGAGGSRNPFKILSSDAGKEDGAAFIPMLTENLRDIRFRRHRDISGDLLGQCREESSFPCAHEELVPGAWGTLSAVLSDLRTERCLCTHPAIVAHSRQYRGDMKQVRKAVIPAAGLGTRFLPATKATPKEMLPIVDKPAIQYVVEEAVAAGLDDVLFVTGRSKRPLEDHFDRNLELELALEAKGDTARLAAVTESTNLAHIHYVRQGDPLGLGHAVHMAEMFVGDEPFAVLLGDDLIDPRDPILPSMIAVRQQFGGSVICLRTVPKEQISLYGCPAVESTSDPSVVQVTDLIEKPDVESAPSHYAVIGRYVLDPAVFAVLAQTAPGRGGEIQLTDALRVLATMPPEQGGGVRGVIFDGRRYDTGDRLSYLQAVIQLATEREDLGPDLRAWLTTFVRDLP
jgi:UTP--glucose-1-phosphate uridylyltransferase